MLVNLFWDINMNYDSCKRKIKTFYKRFGRWD